MGSSVKSLYYKLSVYLKSHSIMRSNEKCCYSTDTTAPGGMQSQGTVESNSDCGSHSSLGEESSLFGETFGSDASMDPSNYLLLLSLKTWDCMGQFNDFKNNDSIFTTQHIHVNSKIAIADDRECIIGTNTLTDRALIGHRDSEIALYIKDRLFKIVKTCLFFVGKTLKVKICCNSR